MLSDNKPLPEPKLAKLRVTGLCDGNSSVTGEFPAQKASNAENVSIWWQHHDITSLSSKPRSAYFNLLWDELGE